MFTAYLLFCIPQLDIALPDNRVLDHPVFLSTQAFCHMLHIQTWNQFILHLHLSLGVSVRNSFCTSMDTYHLQKLIFVYWNA